MAFLQGGKFIVAFDGYTDKEEVRLGWSAAVPSCCYSSPLISTLFKPSGRPYWDPTHAGAGRSVPGCIRPQKEARGGATRCLRDPKGAECPSLTSACIRHLPLSHLLITHALLHWSALSVAGDSRRG